MRWRSVLLLNKNLQTDSDLMLISEVAKQIMDPKMDSGCSAFGEALDDDYDVLSTLIPEDVIGIMDQLLCFEVRYILKPTLVGKISDADFRFRRWHGTWAVHFPKHYLPHTILTGFYGLNQRLSIKHASIKTAKQMLIIFCSIKFCGRTA